jgi:hypothetical protein
MIGLQGPGIIYEDIKAIYGDQDESRPSNEDYLDRLMLTDSTKKNGKEDDIIEEGVQQINKLDKNLEDLINFNLIEVENLDKAGT